MSDYVIQNGELYHHGVKGMKWGVRKVRGHAGPGRYIGKKRQIEGAKKDLEILDNGGHLSVGLTEKRQAALDARDRKLLKKKISKAEKKEQKKLEKAQKKWDKNFKKNYLKAQNSAADYANEILIPKLNAKYSKIIKTEDWREDKNYGKYLKEYEDSFAKVLNKKFIEIAGERPK